MAELLPGLLMFFSDIQDDGQQRLSIFDNTHDHRIFPGAFRCDHACTVWQQTRIEDAVELESGEIRGHLEPSFVPPRRSAIPFCAACLASPRIDPEPDANGIDVGIQRRSGQGFFAGKGRSRCAVGHNEAAGEEQGDARDGKPGKDPETPARPFSPFFG